MATHALTVATLLPPRHPRHSLVLPGLPCDRGDRGGAGVTDINRTVTEKKVAAATATTQVVWPRVLIIQVTPDQPSQYVQIMNCIFAAKKNEVLVDACVRHIKSDRMRNMQVGIGLVWRGVAWIAKSSHCWVLLCCCVACCFPVSARFLETRTQHT